MDPIKQKSQTDLAAAEARLEKARQDEADAIRDERVAVAEDPQSKESRVAAFVTAYAHGLEHNSPRSPAEFKELQFLLGVTDIDPNEPTEDQLEAQRIAAEHRANAEPVKEPA